MSEISCSGLDPGSATEHLHDLAASTGIAVHEGRGRVVHLGENLREVARQLGGMAGQLELFRLGGDLVYFDFQGEMKPMSGRIFRTWIAAHVIIAARYHRETGDPIPGTLRTDDAATILESEDFRRGVREIRAINRVRLPVLRPGGKLELLPWGFDHETRVFTVPGGIVPDENWTPETARSWLDALDESFPYADERSRAVQRAAMMALFCKHLPGFGGLRPGWLWLANGPGAGKSVLAKAALYPVLGSAAAAKLKRGEELDKELEAFSRARVPYIFLDNVYGGLASASIDQLLTSKRSTGRAMGGHGIFETENTALLLVTGNGLELNADAARRFVVIDLFDQGDATARKYRCRLDDDLMESETWRAEALAAMWALVKEWHARGCPPGGTLVPTYERFTEAMGGLVMAAGYTDPFVPAAIPDAIHEGKRDFVDLLKGLVEEMGKEKTRVFPIAEVARIARARGAYVDLLGTPEDGRALMIKLDGLGRDERLHAVDRGDMTQKVKQAFGIALSPHKGKLHTDLPGLKVRFGKRSRRHSEWEVALEE